MRIFGKKLNWDKYSAKRERESQSLCFDFSDSHLKTCFLQKATVSKRYGGKASSPRKQKQQIQKLSALTIGFLKNIYIVIDVERGTIKILKTFKI